MIDDQRVTAIVAAVGQLVGDSGITRASIKDYLTVYEFLIPVHSDDQIANLIANLIARENAAFHRGTQEQAFVPAAKSPESSVTTTPMTIETHDVQEIPSDVSDEDPVATPRLNFPLKTPNAKIADGCFPRTINIHFDDDKEEESDNWVFWRRPVPESAFGKVYFSDDDDDDDDDDEEEEEGVEKENRGI